VLAAGGYPASYGKGDVITGLEQAAELPGKVFHAGTKTVNGHVTTNGGRVLCATALGNTVTEAQSNAYLLVEKINWDKMFHRNDIAYRAIQREQD
jgi:phosphoribosylamine--glycine ligase